MPSLQFEDYVFRIMENQERLGQLIGDSSWGIDIDKGLLVFTNPDTDEIVAELRAQIIGSQSDATKSWLWIWGNDGMNLSPAQYSYAEAVRIAAIPQGESVLTAQNEFVLPEATFGYEMAILCAGFNGVFGYYRCPYEGGSAFAIIASYPAAEALPPDAMRTVRTITDTISVFSFDHSAAVRAYLGEPVTVAGDVHTFRLDEKNQIELTFDSQGRIANISTTLRPA
jgi:hypothetical protein